MLTRIETSDVIRRATRAFDDFNNNCPVKSHTRLTARGPIEVERREGIIPEAITTTFHVILTEYVHNYNRICKMMPLEFQDQANPPALRTNSVRVAKFARCSDRTVRNHVSRLRDLGFVTTKFHGRKHDFELWISNKYLYGEQILQNPENAENAPQGIVSHSERKIFPDNSTHREISEKEKGRADLLIVHGENIQGQRGKTEMPPPPLNEVAENHRESEVAPGSRLTRAEIVAQNARERQQRATAMLESKTARIPVGIPSQYAKILFDFWFYAWKVLYPNRNFSKDQQEKALFAIAAGVFENFQGDWNEQEWANYQQVQLAKLDKAGRYYDNHPDAYRPDPYAVHIPGKGYFDSANLKGFIGIDAWIKKDSIRHARQKKAYADKQEATVKRCEALLRTARRDFERLRANEKPRKEVANHDLVSLFQYYSTTFAGIGKKWQKEFCNQFLVQQANGFKAPDYYKARKLRAHAGERSKETVVIVEPWMNGDGEGYYTNL